MSRLVTLILVMVLSLVTLPGVARAETTEVSGSVAETPTIASLTPNSGNAGLAPPVTIIGTNFIDGFTTVSVDGAGVTAGAVTFTSSTNISATFTIALEAVSGARNVTVTVAGKTSNAVSFTVSSSITVTAPSAINLGQMIAGTTTYGASVTAGSVTTNAGAWQVTAMDEKGTNTGYMTSGSNNLTSKFELSSDNSTFAVADTGVTYDSVTSLPFYARQAVAQGDAGGTYSITITFTGAIL